MNSKYRLTAMMAAILSAGQILFLMAFTGCDSRDAKVYTVPKQQAAEPQALPPGHPDIGSTMGQMPGGMGPMPGAMGSPARPRVSWKAPEGWTEGAPGEMRVGSFRITGSGGKTAEVSVVPLSGMAGGDLANVNRWRGQVGLEALSEEGLKKSAEKVEVAGQPADLYDVAGKNPGDGEPMRIIGAIQPEGSRVWFFKMWGDDKLVAEQKPAFIAFLKSVSIDASEPAGMPPSHPPVDGMTPAQGAAPGAISTEGKPTWQVPAGWQEVPGGEFLIAKFTIADGSNQAAVNVSASAGDGGGLVSNVNRWRQQLGLSPQSDADINKEATSITAGEGKATVVEFSGTDGRTGRPAKIVGAMVARPGQAWFYKLMGDTAVVDVQKEAFTKFVASAKY